MTTSDRHGASATSQRFVECGICYTCRECRTDTETDSLDRRFQSVRSCSSAEIISPGSSLLSAPSTLQCRSSYVLLQTYSFFDPGVFCICFRTIKPTCTLHPMLAPSIMICCVLFACIIQGFASDCAPAVTCVVVCPMAGHVHSALPIINPPF